MSWDCPSCGVTGNDENTVRCICGYELDIKGQYVSNLSPYEAASGIQRFLNWLIDHLVILLLIFIVAFIVGILLGVIMGVINKELLDSTYHKIMWPIVIIITMAYYVIFESITGRTCGKYITKTKVICTDNTNITVKQAIIRTICRYIPFDGLSFILSKGGWHDRISKTIVINLNKPKPFEQLESKISQDDKWF
jgi:uncharacterized RDD family membrane protein YckC